MVQIKWLKQAIADLDEIREYISNDPVKYAEKQVERIWDRTSILEQHIHTGEFVEELNREDVCERVEGRCRIIYQIVGEELVHSLMIHHRSRDLSNRK
jgi:plasmid stabilization system protein ParE